MADFLDEKRNEIGSRLKELKPLVEEYQRLEAAAGSRRPARSKQQWSGAAARSAPKSPSKRRARTPTQRRAAAARHRHRPPWPAEGSGTRGPRRSRS